MAFRERCLIVTVIPDFHENKVKRYLFSLRLSGRLSWSITSLQKTLQEDHGEIPGQFALLGERAVTAVGNRMTGCAVTVVDEAVAAGDSQ